MKDKEMVSLAKHSERFGMTLSNLLSIIGLVILLFGFVIDYNIKFAKMEANIQSIQIEFNLKVQELDKGRNLNAINIERGRIENREEHQILSEKMDQVLNAVRK